MDLDEKVVVVTGAGSGIGRGIAQAFGEAGAKVVTSDLDTARCEETAAMIEKAGGESLAVCTDVSSADAVTKLFENVLEHFGHVDVVVNNAGIYPFVAFAAMQESDWEKVIDVNLTGIFLVSHEALKVMREGGAIVNISSIAARAGFPQLVHYCASKGGVDGFTRALAAELAPQGIRVNAIAPGAIDTPGVGWDAMEPAERDAFMSKIPLQRVGKPEDIANAAVFLASDMANYITGQVLVVDGGWTASS